MLSVEELELRTATTMYYGGGTKGNEKGHGNGKPQSGGQFYATAPRFSSSAVPTRMAVHEQDILEKLARAAEAALEATFTEREAKLVEHKESSDREDPTEKHFSSPTIVVLMRNGASILVRTGGLFTHDFGYACSRRA